ncbi:MAG: MBL fold metallo-hydrolase [Treponema sp.]|nr:MBL fold metallo-hydrolase [Treponema sp.]
MGIRVIKSGIFFVNSLIVSCGEKYVFVVDPADSNFSRDKNKILDYLQKNKLECIGIVLTHSHFDHITGIAPLKQAFPKAVVAIHENEAQELINPPGPMNDSVIRFFRDLSILEMVSKQPPAELLLKDGDTLNKLLEVYKASCKDSNKVLPLEDELCAELSKWKIIHTPGHSPGSICIHNAEEKLFISGDTIFANGGYGRTDMYGGDEALIRQTLSKLFYYIPEGTKIYPGHDSFGFTYSR